jgi:prepilin-type N-terminal cleavage/methylation domain-containing protein
MFNRLKAQDEGFTLIELLMAIVVSGLILGALATAFIATMAGSQNVHERFIESHDAQLLSTYFPSDVQSANPTMVNPPDDAGQLDTTGCGGATSGTHVIRLQWTERDDLNADVNKRLAVFSASYRLVAAPSGSELIRYYCSNAGPAGGSPATILAGATATSHVVAHDLSNVQAPTAVIDPDGRVALTLYSHQTLGEQRANIPPYSYTFSATMRTLGTFTLLDIAYPGPQDAGTSFDLTITARKADGSVDTFYTGPKTITFSGASSSPDNTPPTLPASVDFNLGVGVAPLTLVNAGPTTLNLSQGARRGPVGPFNVRALSGVGGTLSFNPCPPPDTTETHTNSLRATRSMTDTYGNATNVGPAITVGALQAGGGTISPASIPIAANAATSALSFTSQNPGTGLQVTLTGTSSGYSNATCVFTTTADTTDTTPPPAPVVSTSSPGSNRVNVVFSDAEVGVTFECAVDTGAFSACTSPKQYNGQNGTHNYSVRAIDAAGNVSAVTTQPQAA